MKDPDLHSLKWSDFDRPFSLLASFVNSGRLPMAALAIAGDRGAIRSETFGSNETDADTCVRFGIASLTKPLVATAVLQLVGEGRIDLDEPLHRILPDFSARDGTDVLTEVSTRHLLTHTSGVTDIPWNRIEDPPPTRAAILRGVLERPLLDQPGRSFHYANDPFMWLGELIRRIDHQPTFSHSLQMRILDPLGMNNTSFDPTHHDCVNATSYAMGMSLDVARRLWEWRAEVEHPGGGLWSTVDDMVVFGRAILLGGALDGTRILDSNLVDLMIRAHTAGTTQVDGQQVPYAYGLGWAKAPLTGEMPGSPSTANHGGASGSHLWLDPEHDLVVVMLANLWGVEEAVSRSVISAVYEAIEDAMAN